jgi:hypothetical protein
MKNEVKRIVLGRLYAFSKSADGHAAGEYALCIEETRSKTYAGGRLLSARGICAMTDGEAGEFLVERGDIGMVLPGQTAATFPLGHDDLIAIKNMLELMRPDDPAQEIKGVKP